MHFNQRKSNALPHASHHHNSVYSILQITALPTRSFAVLPFFGCDTSPTIRGEFACVLFPTNWMQISMNPPKAGPNSFRKSCCSHWNSCCLRNRQKEIGYSRVSAGAVGSGAAVAAGSLSIDETPYPLAKLLPAIRGVLTERCCC